MKNKFKSVVALAILILIASFNIQAQGSSKPPIWYGVKVGTDINTNTLGNVSFSDMKNNYRAGIFFQFGRSIFVQPEIYYARFEPEIGDAISYFKAPVSLGIQMLDLGILSLNLKGGAEFSRQLESDSDFNFLWQGGVGVNVLGFIVADVRYLLSKGENVFGQFGDLINNGGMVNVTVGLRFR